MRTRALHVCSFCATDDLKGKQITYENVKALVLKAGRFSIFEATKTMRHAGIFDRLCRDPELVIDNKSSSYPWTLVRLKDKP